jgi:hypothetical protein
MSLPIEENKTSQLWGAEDDSAEREENQLSLEPAELLCVLQAENTRLQALVCYLVHVNQELRQQNRATPLAASANDSKTDGA